MTKPKRVRSKSCDICSQPKDVLYRVQVDATQRWQFICRECWEQVSERPDYRYGGTWKARKAINVFLQEASVHICQSFLKVMASMRSNTLSG